jgi:hypothetical protein
LLTAKDLLNKFGKEVSTFFPKNLSTLPSFLAIPPPVFPTKFFPLQQDE